MTITLDAKFESKLVVSTMGHQQRDAVEEDMLAAGYERSAKCRAWNDGAAIESRLGLKEGAGFDACILRIDDLIRKEQALKVADNDARKTSEAIRKILSSP